MTRPVRKNQTYITSLFISGILLLPLLLIVFLQLWQFQIRHSAEERMERQSLQTIVVASNKIHWEKKGKEVSIDGALFDVKSFSKSGDNFILTGIWDTKETLIKNILKKQAGAQGAGIIQMMLLGQCFVAIVFLFTGNLFKRFTKRLYGPHQVMYLPPCITIVAPPPR